MLSRVQRYDKKAHQRQRAKIESKHKLRQKNNHIQHHQNVQREQKWHLRWSKYRRYIHLFATLFKISFVCGLILGCIILIVLLLNDLNIPEAIIIGLVGMLMITLWKKTA